ncbi:hypothetical protein EJ06DRAFT_527320 [Trichodelitschia bisporula]|uniref:Uncharacterized protein n=1 Tax=Trichodelitschia bisporula TaxID=703511 RepID=A0A6G1I6G5_9PEZI|nr:hypothetical protein EJ06DRAFT_527320 [Trichodelitschia bisporula]
MAWKLKDRWLWLGLGALAFLATRGVANAVLELLQLTKIHEEPRRLDVSRATEDAIQIDTLKVLAQSSNPDIRRAAIQIVCNRFFHDTSARQAFGDDCIGPDARINERGRRTLHLLQRYSKRKIRIPSLIDDLLPTTPDRTRARPHEESPEEQALRRRRREAIVLNEGDRPLSQDDIIQRGGRPRDDETSRTERALANLAVHDDSVAEVTSQ